MPMNMNNMTLPSDFEAYTRPLMGERLYGILKEALGREAPVSIRVNPFKWPCQNIKEQDPGRKVEWCPYGLYLADRPAFTFDPLLHAGAYYVQEASSMFVCEVVRQLIERPVTMLDLCAAPGGKSTALRTALPEGSLLFANEPVKTRASILKENVEKFGHPDMVVTNNYPKDYRKAKLSFDAILADVPCSGEGMFRKDPNAISEWSAANVEKCRTLQRSIIEDIWPCLKPGGMLIYSTCTFNAHEDEENVEWIAETFGAEFVKITTNDGWGITGSLKGNIPVCRFIPGKTRGEGLFMAVLRKHGETGKANNLSGSRQDKKADGRQRKGTNGCEGWLDGDFTVMEDKGFVRAIPKRWTDIYNNVAGRLHVIHAGVGIGTIKGKDIIPDASLSLSLALNRNAFPMAELDYGDAIRYLRKEAIVLDPSVPKGFTIVTYKGLPLGFVKNLGNRANNLYPQEWRIKSTHVAGDQPMRSPLDNLQDGSL